MKKPFLLIISIILLILICEIAIRFLLGANLRMYSSLPYQPDSIISYRYIPNSKGIFINKALKREYSINSLGFPAENFNIKKANGAYRIIVVGQSDETGLNTDGPSNFISLLNEKFKRDSLNVEVLNFSIDGGRRGVQNVKLINECKKYKPDLILLRREYPLYNNEMFRWTYKGIVMGYQQNDLDSVKTFVDEKLVRKDMRLHLLDYSYTYRLLSKLYKKHHKEYGFIKWIGKPFFITNKSYGSYIEKKITWSSKKEKYKPVKLSEEESLGMLNRLNRELKFEGIVLVIYDTYVTKGASTWKTLFSENNILYLPLQIKPEPEFSFGKDDGHSTQKGHEAIAQALDSVLRTEIINSRTNELIKPLAKF